MHAKSDMYADETSFHISGNEIIEINLEAIIEDASSISGILIIKW